MTAYNPDKAKNAARIRESYSGRILTDSQFNEAMSITGIMEHEIRKSGTFKEKLADYSYAFSRSEKFDAMRAETIIRDLFKERYGQTMNQMRRKLKDREENITDDQRDSIYKHAIRVGEMIELLEKMPFYRAYAHQAGLIADRVGITASCAKSIMKEEFEKREGMDLYEWGRDLEKRHNRSQTESTGRVRTAGRSRTKSRRRS